MTELYKRDTYKNPNISYVFNQPIIEYDMKDAGFSIAQKYGLITKKEVKKLSSVGKQERRVLLGNIQRDREKVKLGIAAGFIESRRLFFKENDISDEDVISIKRDAIFLIGYVKTERLDPFINFRQKNVYSSFIKLGKIELFYNSNKIDVKGIGDDIIEKHEGYMLDFLNTFFKKMEGSDRTTTLNFLRVFMDNYRLGKLDREYYREFNPGSKFRYIDGTLTDVDYMDDFSMIDISCNYKIITDLVKIAI